jgi:hypothetical protein
MTYKEWVEKYYKPIEPIIDHQKAVDRKAREARKDWLSSK